jgi:hypothetical protein
MVAPQARQRGGKTPSTTARPIRRSGPETKAAKVAEASIATHHQVGSGFVNG